MTGRSLLAHSASRMGEVVLNTICGEIDAINYDTIPWAIFSIPKQLVAVAEAQAIERGIEVKTAKLPMRMSGRFLVENGKRGAGEFKVVMDAKTEQLIGVSMFGAGCSEIIFGAALMIESKMKVDDLKKVVFPHPTVGEVLRDTIFAL